MQDQAYMNLAISMARATSGQTSPNPCVGSVIVKNGQIIGMGAHLKAGTEHAEIHALKQAGDNACGSTLYVTLEPCSHYGKTPPCTKAIIEAGVSMVKVAILDPNPLVAGKGIEQLREAGIEVEVGIEEATAADLNIPFFHYIQTKKPYVTLKTATSFDGKVATQTGDSKWITSPESRSDVHQLRHKHDAILVGVNTIISDNPQLTTRLPHGGKNPIRIVLDTSLRTPISSHVVTDLQAKTIIFTTQRANKERVNQLSKQSVEVIQLDTDCILIEDVLTYLGEKGITSLLVEGGPTVHASFIEAGAFQQIVTYIAPMIIGGKHAFPSISGLGVEFVKNAPKLKFISIEQKDQDLKIVAEPLTGSET
jgi:diaminohydroxyphosphoribosylaminopyrimidine deaminase/5-amino-6-(5-phosphoribosylamino)uracil reductase